MKKKSKFEIESVSWKAFLEKLIDSDNQFLSVQKRVFWHCQLITGE